MTAPMDCLPIGRWRIVEADIWERDYLDLVEPAMMTIGADGHGEIAFGAKQAGLDLAYVTPTSPSPGPGSTKWTRSAAPDQQSSLMTGTPEIEFDHNHGNDAPPARRTRRFFNS